MRVKSGEDQLPFGKDVCISVHKASAKYGYHGSFRLYFTTFAASLPMYSEPFCFCMYAFHVGTIFPLLRLPFGFGEDCSIELILLLHLSLVGETISVEDFGELVHQGTLLFVTVFVVCCLNRFRMLLSID